MGGPRVKGSCRGVRDRVDTPDPYLSTCWMVQRLTSRSLASSRWLTPFDRSARMYSRCRSVRLGRRLGKRPSARAFACPATERSRIEFRHHSLKASTIVSWSLPVGCQMREIPIRTSIGEEIRLSPGRHNRLQAQVVTDFGPKFAPGAMLLYLGDAANKLLHLEEEKLAQLGVPITEHDKLPDVILYDEEREWLFLVEAVTSHGPLTADDRVTWAQCAQTRPGAARRAGR